MLSMMVGQLARAIDDYDGTPGSFSEIMREAHVLSRQIRSGRPDFTRTIAEKAGVDTNVVGAWINGKMCPHHEEHRRAVLGHVRAWFLPSSS